MLYERWEEREFQKIKKKNWNWGKWAKWRDMKNWVALIEWNCEYDSLFQVSYHLWFIQSDMKHVSGDVKYDGQKMVKNENFHSITYQNMLND